MNIIVAQLENGIIGINNDLPWKNVLSCSDISKQDMAFFKEMTVGCSLVMGWNTWVSLGKKPLKNRETHYIITSKDIKVDISSNVKYITLENFINILPKIDNQELWCIGGATLYKALKKYCTEIYISTLKPKIKIKTEGHDITFLDNSFKNDEYIKKESILNREFAATGNKISICKYIQEPFHKPQR